MRYFLIAGITALLLAPTAASADSPIIGQRKVTVRVHDTTMRARVDPLRVHAHVTSVAFYVDGNLAPSMGVGSTCRVTYSTARGVVIRLDGCGSSDTIKVAVANVGDHPHRVTVRIRFVV